MAPPKTEEPKQFADGPIDGVVSRSLVAHGDTRGWLAELFRIDELPAEQHPAMTYVTWTLPEIARGPHEHTEQTDYFAFVGPGDFTLYLWDIRVGSPTWGHRSVLTVGESHKAAVIVPPGIVHGYRNTGNTPGLIFNACNRLYAGEGRRGPVDEIRHEERKHHPYQMD